MQKFPCHDKNEEKKSIWGVTEIPEKPKEIWGE